MSRSFFEELALEGVREVKVKDKVFYILKPTSLNNALFEVMQDAELTGSQKMNKALACTICDSLGNLEFDINSEEDLKLISKIPDDYLNDIITELMNSIFPSKKK